ncbi:MAG TPA: alpha/beta hydrolase [Pseudolabrys sp.]|nr:alpha/beta hydrolase [Pseudolabrys sp.]
MAQIDYETEYNNRGRVPEYQQIFDRWERDAAAYRETMKPKGVEIGVRYGTGERQTYDYFPGNDPHPGAPLAVFIHGGYWRSLSPSMHSWAARGMNAHGISVAVPGYDLCPNCTIADIITQTRNALLALWRKHKKRMLVVGHSAGGHLAACMTATEWHSVSKEPPNDLVPFGYSISGVFDFMPLLKVSQNADLRLDEKSAEEVSPLTWKLPAQRSLDAVVGAEESSEFLRQSQIIADDWAKKGAVTHYEAVPGTNHFTVVDALADPDSAMTARVARLAERVNAMALGA